MAKRRRSTFSRIKKYARHHRGAAIGVLSIVLGTVGYLVFDALVKPYIPISGVVLSIAEIGLGFWLASRKTGWVKNIGLAAIFLNMFVLAKMYITPSLQSIIPGIAV